MAEAEAVNRRTNNVKANRKRTTKQSPVHYSSGTSSVNRIENHLIWKLVASSLHSFPVVD